MVVLRSILLLLALMLAGTNGYDEAEAVKLQYLSLASFCPQESLSSTCRPCTRGSEDGVEDIRHFFVERWNVSAYMGLGH